MIQFRCAQCDHEMQSPDSLAGRKDVCPKCSVANWVPQSAAIPQATIVDQPRAPVQSMNCPKCGKSASEYQPNKWKCLHCGRKFIYEPPRHPDNYVKVEHVTTIADDSFYICGSCGGKFPKHSYAEFTCTRCKKSVCPEHVDKQSKGYCKKCAAAQFAIGCLVIVIATVVIVAIALVFVGR